MIVAIPLGGITSAVHEAEIAHNKELGLRHAVHGFLVHLEAAGRASNTIDCYDRDLRRLAEILGDIHLDKIRSEDLENAIVILRYSTPSVVKRSSSTMNRMKSAYRSFFKWSFESGRMPCNPTASLHMAKANSKRTVPITIEETLRLLETIRKSDDPQAGRDEALFATYAFTGIRRAEALALRKKDFDPVSSLLYLPETKGGNRDWQPVPSRLVAILKKRILKMKRNGHSAKWAALFPGRHPEQPLSVRQANVRFDKWKRLGGIRESLTIHSFRAGFATSLYETTGDILLVARALGHNDIRTTKRYIGNNTPAIREAVEKTFS